MPDTSPPAIRPGSCSKAHQSLLVLLPSTWWAAVAVAQRKPGGKVRPTVTTADHRRRPLRSRRPPRRLYLRRRLVLPRRRLAVLELDLQHARPVDGAAVHLDFVVGSAVEQDPGRLERVGVADQRDG